MIGGQRTAAAALLISVFIAGVLGGAAGTKLMDRRSWRRDMEGVGRFDRQGVMAPRMRGMEGGIDKEALAPMWFSYRLADELDLSEDQQDKVRSILDARREEAEGVLEEFGPRLRAHWDTLHLEIRTILTTDQQALFDGFRQREDERMFRRMSSPWPGGPPGGFP